MMTGKVVKKVAILFLGGGILIYVLYHLCAAKFFGIKTETARVIRVFDDVDAQAYIIRDEKIIAEDLSGFVNFTLDDAEKIEKNGVVALVYSSENQGLLSKKAELLKNEIKQLENLKNFGYALSSSLNSIDQQAYLELNDFIKNIRNYEFNKLTKKRNNILYLLSERQLAAGKNLNLTEKIAQLNDELKQLNLQNNNVKKVLAQDAGFFVGNVDGFENSFDYQNVLEITSEQVASLLKNNSSAINNQKSAKLVTNSKWFVVCNLKKNDALKLSVDQYVELFMPLVSANKLLAKVVAINQLDKNSPAAVVFQCDFIDKNILSVRNEPLKINIAEYEGLCVNKNAVHEKKLSRSVIINEETSEKKFEEKIVKGVYVKHGRQLAFKEIDIIFSADNYVICSTDINKSKLFSDNTIKEYDEIVVNGHDLYDGKFV